MAFERNRKQTVSERIVNLQQTLLPQLNMEFEERGRKTKRRIDESLINKDYFTNLYSTREFHASDCLQRLCRGSGLRHELEGFSGTLINPWRISNEKLDEVWDHLRGDLDGAWSQVALEDGVKQARAGKYDEALEAYKQSLKLNPSNSDAYVAKGAALANKGQYQDAIRDFDKALEINPINRNAVDYKKRIERRVHERETKVNKSDSNPKIQYREDLFGRTNINVQKPEVPDDSDVQHAFNVLTKHHKRKKPKSKRHKQLAYKEKR